MIRPARPSDFLAIANDLCENHDRMLRALAPDAPLGPLMRLADVRAIAVTVEHDGKPVAVAGASFSGPDAASIFLFAAKDAEIAAADNALVTQFFKQTLFPAMAPQARFVHHGALADDEESAGWMRREFGDCEEQVCEAQGRNGEDFIVHSLSLQPPGDGVAVTGPVQ